jgi:hypothetical protein
MARRTDGRRLLSRFHKVKLVEGRRASAQVSRGVLQVTVAPPQGLAGRPSSERIMAAAAAAQ